MTIDFDGESVLDEASGDWPLKIDQASFDLLQEICNQIQFLSVDIKWRWVEGHQKKNAGKNLDW